MKKSLKIILIVLAALILICAAAIGIFYIRINNPANVFDHLSGTPAPVDVTPTPAQETPAPTDAAATPVVIQSAEPTPEPTPTPISEAELESMADLSLGSIYWCWA